MSGCGCEVEIKNQEQRRVLILLLAINGVMFVAEIIAGIIGDSTGSSYPDLIVGLLIAAIVVRGGVHIFKDASAENEREERCHG